MESAAFDEKVARSLLGELFAAWSNAVSASEWHFKHLAFTETCSRLNRLQRNLLTHEKLLTHNGKVLLKHFYYWKTVGNNAAKLILIELNCKKEKNKQTSFFRREIIPPYC